MKLKINGEERFIEAKSTPLTLAELIKRLDHHPRLVVVEFNGIILPPNKWERQEVNDGDNLEIVTIVGGGSYS